MPPPSVAYLIFDIESVADGDACVAACAIRASSCRRPTAVARYRAELLAKFDSDFIPYTFQVPTSLAIAKVAADYRLIDLVALDEPSSGRT